MNPIAIAVPAVFVAALSFGSFFVVDQGERSIVTRNGAIVAVKDAGLHYKMPFMDTEHTVDMRTKAILFEDIDAVTSDQQRVELNLSVNYSIPADRVEEFYTDYQNEGQLRSRLIERQALSTARAVFGTYNATRAITERTRLIADVTAALREAIKGPVQIESVQVEGVSFSADYQERIKERMNAEIEVQKLMQNAKREEVQAEIVVTQAKAQAEATKSRSAAEAEAIRSRGNAEAEAIRAKGAALRDNPALKDLIAAERWDGKLPTSMVPSTAVPFINVGK